MTAKSESLSATARPVSPTDQNERKPRSWKWLFIGFNLCIAAGAIAVGSLLWIISLPPAPDCEQLSAITPDSERLFCAQQAAQSGEADDLIAALHLVEPWGEHHPLFAQKQQQLEIWSASILNLARQRAYDSDLETAVDLAQRVPSSSPLYDQAQATIQDWQTEWQQGEAVYAKAQNALKAADWDTAQAQVKELSQFSHAHWRSRKVQALAQQLSMERQAHQVATQAQQMAAQGTTQDLQNAIAKAQTLNQSTYSWTALQPQLKAWNQQLLQQGLQLWYDGNLTQAIALGQVVKQHPDLRQSAQDLVGLSQARQRAVASTPNWEPTLAHLWHLRQAIAIASAIEPESQFYPQAVSSIESWTQQLADLQKLYHAQLAANFETKSSYQKAIQQAQQVAADRPRRVQSQTLVAHWQNEIERIEDRPHLVAARQLAASGLANDLRHGIARAQHIAPGRALYGEAQDLIARWQSDLQRIEDRPVLNKARDLAEQGQLEAAIATAQRIQPGRLLYRQTQILMEGWEEELRILQMPDETELEPQSGLDGLMQPPYPEGFPPEFSPGPSPAFSSPGAGYSEPRRSQTPGVSGPAEAPAPDGGTAPAPPLPNLTQPQPSAPGRAGNSPAAAAVEAPYTLTPLPMENTPPQDLPPAAPPQPAEKDAAEDQPQAVLQQATFSGDDISSCPDVNCVSTEQPQAPQRSDDTSAAAATTRFNVQAELSQDAFPLIFAGALYAGI